MSKNLWAKYQQENRERLQKKLDQNLPKEGKEKKQQHGREPYKTLSKRKKNLLSIEKILQNEKKCFIIIIRKYFHLEILLLYKGKYKKLFLFCGYY